MKYLLIKKADAYYFIRQIFLHSQSYSQPSLITSVSNADNLNKTCLTKK
jgi:hypothetical protein